MTKHVPSTEVSKNFNKYMDKARTAPVYIKRGVSTAVLVSREEFEGWKETVRLLSNPANAKDLREGIAEAEAGKFEEHELIDE